MITSSLTEWILLIILGGLAGALGQSARVLVGIKKLDDQVAVLEGKSHEDLLSVSRLIISIVIGFVAGALAALTTKHDQATLTSDQILAFMAAGYAGADFIEGAMMRFVPKSSAASSTKEPGAPPPPSSSLTLEGKSFKDTLSTNTRVDPKKDDVPG